MMPSSLSAIDMVFLTLLAICSYFLLLFSPQIKSTIGKFSSAENRSLAWRMYERLSGALILGILPALIIYKTVHENAGTSFFFTATINRFYLISVCCIATIIINFLTTSKARNRAGYPLIRNKNWNGSLLLLNQFSWVVYLFGYEYLLRGVFFSSSTALFGLQMAIVINVLLYSLLHFHRGIKQMIFSIPFGVVLCLLVIATSSWISAALLHTTFAVSYEFFVIAYRNKWLRLPGRKPRRSPQFRLS